MEIMEIILGALIFVVIFSITTGVLSNKISKMKNGNTIIKNIMKTNMAVFGCLMLVAIITIFSVPSFAAEAATTAETIAKDTSFFGMGLFSAALATGLSTIGAGIAVAVTGSAALGAISEDSSLLGKSLIFVGLAEGIAIYGLIISIMILQKIV